MEVLTGAKISELCDYSFGDHFALWDSTMIGAFFKFANAENQSFLEKARSFKGKTMTLFIDNIRLYPRKVKTDSKNDEVFVRWLMLTNNLLALCSLLPDNEFVIFTGQEDTPIDEHIAIPYNVKKIYAVNAVYNNNKIVPFPYGLQRKRGEHDNRLQIMKANVQEDRRVTPNKLLYINCGIGRNEDRKPLEKFETNDWVTARFDKDSMFFPYDRYQDFLDEIRDHKFMVCPPGHGMDCHRNWESLYLRRVPIMKNHPYFKRLMSGLPVLFVDDWSEITKELLEQNEHLFEKAQSMDLLKLDAEYVFKSIVNENIGNTK